MTEESTHIVKSFDEELRQLRDDVARMGGMVEENLAAAVEALARRNSAAAERVIESDQAIDELEDVINDLAVRMIALRQPMANDLRQIIAAIKIASDLERIGDYAKNVAKRSIVLSQLPPMPPANTVPRLAQLVQDHHQGHPGFLRQPGPGRAIDAWYRDAKVDEMYTGLFRELLTYMMEDPRNITPCTHLLFMAKNIERMGDHATNVGETIHFLVTGERIEGGRPKGDSSSFEIVSPEDNGEATS